MPCNSKVYHATVASCTIVAAAAAAVVVVHTVVVKLLRHGRIAASPER